MYQRRFKVVETDVPTQVRQTAEMLEILHELSDRERNALISFYFDRKSEEEIEAAFGLSVGRFRELRRSTKAAFFARTAQPESVEI